MKKMDISIKNCESNETSNNDFSLNNSPNQ